jgi:hypothetical protein
MAALDPPLNRRRDHLLFGATSRASFDANNQSDRWDERWLAAILRLVQVPILAFVFVQQKIGEEIQTVLDYPPMQRGASFSLDAVKAEMSKKMEEAERASKGPGQ